MRCDAVNETETADRAVRVCVSKQHHLYGAWGRAVVVLYRADGKQGMNMARGDVGYLNGFTGLARKKALSIQCYIGSA
jgi:hypothetical protein